jgi:hypothetical protein
MTEIRICWSKEVSRTKLSGSEGGLWIPETPKNRDELEAYPRLHDKQPDPYWCCIRLQL